MKKFRTLTAAFVMALGTLFELLSSFLQDEPFITLTPAGAIPFHSILILDTGRDIWPKAGATVLYEPLVKLQEA